MPVDVHLEALRRRCATVEYTLDVTVTYAYQSVPNRDQNELVVSIAEKWKTSTISMCADAVDINDVIRS